MFSLPELFNHFSLGRLAVRIFGCLDLQKGFVSTMLFHCSLHPLPHLCLFGRGKRRKAEIDLKPKIPNVFTDPVVSIPLKQASK